MPASMSMVSRIERLLARPPPGYKLLRNAVAGRIPGRGWRRRGCESDRAPAFPCSRKSCTPCQPRHSARCRPGIRATRRPRAGAPSGILRETRPPAFESSGRTPGTSRPRRLWKRRTRSQALIDRHALVDAIQAAGVVVAFFELSQRQIIRAVAVDFIGAGETERRFLAEIASGNQQVHGAEGIDVKIVVRNSRGLVVRGLGGSVNNELRPLGFQYVAHRLPVVLFINSFCCRLHSLFVLLFRNFEYKSMNLRFCSKFSFFMSLSSLRNLRLSIDSPGFVFQYSFCNIYVYSKQLYIIIQFLPVKVVFKGIIQVL